MNQIDNFIFFWGKEDVYSNFYYSPFTHQGIIFKWSEQGVMYRKAMLFGAERIANLILEASSPKACKELGRSKAIPFNEEVWAANRERIYEEVLYDKFSKSPLKQAIIRSWGSLLAEASPYDKIWGIGLRWGDPLATQPDRWPGKNLLGQVLMRVRDRLIAEEG